MFAQARFKSYLNVISVTAQKPQHFIARKRLILFA
jgi:hypothetical protein